MTDRPQDPTPTDSPTVWNLETLVDYQPGAVVSHALVKKSAGTVTLFAFGRGEGLSEHTAPFDALVQILDGTAEITVGGKPHVLGRGEAILMPGGVPHALSAPEPFKMLLTMIRKP